MADWQGYTVCDGSASSFSSDHGRGYEGRDLDKYPRGGLKCAKMVDRPQIDPKLFKEIIKEKDAKGKWINIESDRRKRRRKNQSRTNYCWNNAGTGGCELRILMQGGPLLNLSAAYAGSMITGGSNVGGSGIVFVKWAHEHGVPTTEFWAENKISGRDDDVARKNAACHKIELYNEFDPQDHDAIAASILCDSPVTIGIPSWGHEVDITQLAWDDSAGRVKFIFDNSWGDDWGKNGRGVLEGSYLRWDEAGSIVAVTVSAA